MRVEPICLPRSISGRSLASARLLMTYSLATVRTDAEYLEPWPLPSLRRAL